MGRGSEGVAKSVVRYGASVEVFVMIGSVSWSVESGEMSSSSGLAMRKPPKDWERLRSFSIVHIMQSTQQDVAVCLAPLDPALSHTVAVNACLGSSAAEECLEAVKEWSAVGVAGCSEVNWLWALSSARFGVG